MRIRVFRAGEGRALLVAGASRNVLLVDAGTAGAYRQYVAPALGKYPKVGFVSVSAPVLGCVDGVRQMLDDLVAWRVYEYQHADSRRSTYPRPRHPRPPMPAVAWFNPLDAVLGRTLGDLEGPLAAYGSWFGQPDGSSAEERVLRSLRESRLLARRLSQLQVRNNESFDGALVHVRRTAAPLSVGTLEIHLLGPHQSDVERSRAEWGVWLQEVGEAPLQMIARQAAPGATSALRASPSAVAVQPGERRPSGVPAIPSHILLVKEGASSVLLAGQATADEVLRGLASQGWTDSNGLARVSALDVPARAGARFGHGEFFKRVIADDYIVQGDTAMLAAAPEVIESLFAARAGSAFRLWIAATTHDETTERAAAVRALQQLVKDHAKANREATCTLLGARAASLEFPI